MNFKINFIFIFALLFLVACEGDESQVPAKTSTQGTVSQTDNKSMVGIDSEQDANNKHVPGVDASLYVEQAFLYLEQNKSKYGFENPRSQLVFKNEKTDNLDFKHVKFQQVHNDIPVWGREIIVHLNENNDGYGISGELLTGLSMSDTQPSITKEEAGDVVLEAEKWGGEGWQIKGIKLYILNFNNNNYLTYQLVMKKGLLREFVFVGAHDGKIIHSISGTHTTN